MFALSSTKRTWQKRKQKQNHGLLFRLTVSSSSLISSPPLARHANSFYLISQRPFHSLWRWRRGTPGRRRSQELQRRPPRSVDHCRHAANGHFANSLKKQVSLWRSHLPLHRCDIDSYTYVHVLLWMWFHSFFLHTVRGRKSYLPE